MQNKKLTVATGLLVFSLCVNGMAQAESGTAVHYSDKFQGRTTANGEIFDQEALTTAHKTLKFGTKIKVTNVANNKSVVVKVNDRMARKNSNAVDLTRRAARELDFEKQGKAQVQIEIVQ